MKRLLTLGSVLALATIARAGEIDPSLEAILDEAPPDKVISTLVYLPDQVDTNVLTTQLDAERATIETRNTVVIRELHDLAQATQADLLATCDVLQLMGRIALVKPLWVANCLRVDATASEIRAIARRPDVERVYYNFRIELVAPVDDHEADGKGGAKDDGGGAATVGGVEPGVQAVRAPEVWNLGITGEGVCVATLDTGVDGNHPALASRWRGVADPAYAGHPEWAFFDPVTNWTFPQADGLHGTHTMGTVCGGPPGDQIGVAPGAVWIHAAVIDRVDIPTTVADAILAFQWLLNPDNNFLTGWDMPAVCSNSWGLADFHGYPDCDETFWTPLDSCEAAGIVMLFSAGNEGTGGLRRPADRATDEYRTLAVAAVDGNVAGWPIAGFSSRGPTFCTPSGDAAIKPDISAPGVSVRSSVPGGGYSQLDGTSMASPHVNGVVALIRQACPALSVNDIKQILYDTAFDLGAPGEDNDYGWGMVDAYEAVQLALALCGPGPPRADDQSLQTPVDAPLSIALTAVDYDGEPNPPGAITYHVTSLPPAGHTLTDEGNGHVITPGELPYELVGGGHSVTYTPAGGYYGTESFQFVANDGGVPPDGGDSDPATISVLVLFGPPAITTASLPDGYLDLPYGPVQFEADQGQPPLTWSLGSALEYDEADLGESQFEVVGTAMGWHADDNSWNYALPFTFPFYGSDYAQVWVTSNGFLSLDGATSDYSNTDSELIAATRIAPLWDDLRTDTGGDIYIDDTVPGQVTFRWETVTYSGSNPCNHSCTLYQDGRIRFHYGSGNTGLTPTIGVSSGDGTNYLLSSYNNAGSLTDANSHEIFPPSPLPDGMTFDPGGSLGGAPTASGAFLPRFKVTDSLGRTDQVQLSLTIGDEPPSADLDGSGAVDFADLLILLGDWGPCDDPPAPCPADLDGNGSVGFGDLLILLGAWG